MQFLLGGYSLGQPGLVMEPLSLVRNPPHAAGGTREVALPSRSPCSRKGHEKWARCMKEQMKAWVWSLLREGGGGGGGVSTKYKEMKCVHGHFHVMQAKPSAERAEGE